MTTLALAIAAYRAGLADYNLNAPEDNDAADAYAQISYVPPLQSLRQWSGPAGDRATAVLALETALSDLDVGDIDTAEVLVRAAFDYLRVAA